MRPRNSIIPMFIPHLGCPHDCVFCNQKHISGQLLPVRAEDVRETIDRALPKCAGAPQVAFYGGSFTAIDRAEQNALLDAVAPYIAEGRVSSIRLSTRPDAIDDEILTNLKAHGVDTIELGAQSMDDGVLAASRRGHDAAQTARAAELIKARGFRLILQMMTGLPGSSPEKDIQTARAIVELKPDGVRIYPTVVIRDTGLCGLWLRGEYREHSVDDAVAVCAEIVEIFRDAGIEVIRLGLNPTDDLSGGEALAGAYHPALGELVRSRIYFNRAMELLSDVPEGADVILGVNRSAVSQMTGQKRRNINELCEKLRLGSLRVTSCDVEPGEIRLISA